MHAVFKDSLDKRIALAQGMLSEWLRLGPSILLTPPLPCTSSSRVVAAIGMYHRVLDPENFTMVLDHVDSNNRPDFMYRVGAGHESSQKIILSLASWVLGARLGPSSRCHFLLSS